MILAFTVLSGVALSVFLALLFMMLCFQIIKTRDNKQAKTQLVFLKQSIQLNQDQLKKRQAYLNRYTFSEYNLSEALIIQSEIDIC